MSRPFNKYLLPAILVGSCVAVSGMLFFWVTFPRLKQENPRITIPERRPSPDELAPNEPLLPESIEEQETPISALKTLVRQLALGDVTGLESLALSDSVESKKQELLAAISSGELEIDSDEAVTEISRGDSSDRWGINLLHKNTGKSAQLVIDFELNEGSWEIRNLRLAPEIQEMEALGVAEQFVQALVNGDYPAAQTWITADSVDSEKLAGLSIVIEEAAFQLIEREPLMVTSVSDERAWIIVRVMSEELNLRSDFGLEMINDGEWRISQVNLSRLMNQFSKARDEADSQLPIVTDPQGGELIALYFEYDTATLDARGIRQLGIVASLIKGKGDRKINIAGHTDALGEDPYNDRLSAERAEQVKRVLLDFGIAADQITTTAYGRRKPIRPNTRDDGTDNPEGRQLNRRAEIYLDFQSDR